MGNRDNRPTFGSFSLIAEKVLSHEEIDKDDPTNESDSDTRVLASECSSSDDELNSDADITFTVKPTLGPLQGYEYPPFQPKDEPRTLPGHVNGSPTLHHAVTALHELDAIVRPRRNKGAGYKDPDLDLYTRARLEGMQSMLRMYTMSNSQTYLNWGASGLQAAVGMGHGRHCARRLRELCKAYLTDRSVLPLNPYGNWNESALVDEALCNEINIFLMSIGKDISAEKLMTFLHQPDIKAKYGIERNISIRTARRYLNCLGYRYRATPKGQYVDGHERVDVVYYRETVFLPRWRQLQQRMATWDNLSVESTPPGRWVIAWFHDESIFYAHDRRKKSWYHKDAPAKPYVKGEGASLMVADYVSQDFGWLQSLDGKQSAQRLFKPGKNRDGYFSNEDIRNQATAAMDILQASYPEFNHVFVYDNATTHLKRADDALSARKMPKNIPRPGTNWGIEVTSCDPVTGKPICNSDGTHQKIKIQMKGAYFADGTTQDLYFPQDHPCPGVFKGMAIILQERGFGDLTKTRAECKGFKCKVGVTDCCCHRILFNQPDFTHISSLLELLCKTRNVEVLFLPKFHCELNFIEQCWGRAKSIYRTYPESSREDQLEANTILAIESIPLSMMQKFAKCSLRFMDAYSRGLNGRQAAWASRKYRGH